MRSILILLLLNVSCLIAQEYEYQLIKITPEGKEYIAVAKIKNGKTSSIVNGSPVRRDATNRDIEIVSSAVEESMRFLINGKFPERGKSDEYYALEIEAEEDAFGYSFKLLFDEIPPWLADMNVRVHRINEPEQDIEKSGSP